MSEGGSQGDNLTLRGFTARNDIFLDGMRDFGSYYRDSFNYQEVEVLEGPSSVTFGRGSTGGVINQESKSPVDHPFIIAEGDFGTDITRRFAADINHKAKLPLGHMVVYPSSNLHRVEPVTRGRRVSSFFWIQSMVRSDEQRTLLFDLDNAAQRVNLDTPTQWQPFPSLLRC